jgi:RNA polymerase sigma-70 factor (ECF subfamily)
MVDLPSDQELLRLTIAGDEDAFIELYRRCSGGLFRFALRMSGSRSIAEEVTQDVFMALLEKAGGYEPQRGSVQAYLFGIARNHVLRQLDRERRYVGFAGEDEEKEPGGEPIRAGCDPLGDLTQMETVTTVRQAILALPTHYREVVVLCELHEMSYAEAAGVVGCAIGTVRSRLSRGRALLIDKLRSARLVSPHLSNRAGCQL